MTNQEDRRLGGSGRRVTTAGVLLSVVVLLAAACGSSGGGTKNATGTTAAGSTGTTAAGSTGTTVGATATGTPLNLLTLASVNYNGPNYDNILQTAKVAGDWINAHGGIQGHPVKVTTCDEQGDPNKTAACGRQAIAGHDVAVVGSFTLNGSSVIPELAQANIAWFAICCAASADELTSPDSTQLGSGTAILPGLVVKAVVDGCKHIALVLLNAGAIDQFSETLAANAIKSVNGPPLTRTVLIPITAQDYTPEVAQATQGTDCIVADLSQANFPSFMPAFVQAGDHQRLYGAQGNLDITVAKPFPQPTENAVVGGAYSDLALPVWADYRQALSQYHAPTNENYNSLGGLGTWAAYMAFVQVADAMTGPINNVTFDAAAQKATINLPGLVAKTDFAVPFTGLGPSFRNANNDSVTFDVIHNGALQAFDGGKFFDMTNAMLGKPLPTADLPPAGQAAS